MRFIRHITLTTGHSRDSFAGEVSAEALAACRGVVERLSKSRQPVPGFSDFEVTGARQACSMVLTVWRAEIPIITMGVATHSRDGASLWRVLHETAAESLQTEPQRCPPEPWAAVLIHGGIALVPNETLWVGDFERCIAWAFYDIFQR